jgi:CheY-like chemotaxis protein
MSKPNVPILVVDDVPQNLMAMRASLAEDGITVLTAESGPAALELLLEHEVAVALLDVQMAGMDGYALAELMRGTERTRHVPIVFLTAGSRDEARTFRGYEAGAVDFLYKPVDMRVLRAKVQVFIDLHRQRRQIAERMAEIERVSRVNALMLAALSHDIRTPLAAMSMNAELVIRKSDTPGLKQAGERIKAATAMLSKHVDHLVNLASLPGGDLRPVPVAGDMAALTQARISAAQSLMLPGSPIVLSSEGDTSLNVDPLLMGEALDQLILIGAMHAGNQPVRIEVDGVSRRAVVVRMAFDAVLGETARQHLFGGGESLPGMPLPRVGPGLHAPEQVARAHGGSLVGRSREREGTLFEMILPRADA